MKRVRWKWMGVGGGLLVVAAVVVYVWVWGPRAEERRIRKRLRTFAHLVSRKKGASALRVAVVSERLPGFFDDPVDVAVPEVGISGRFTSAELSSHISRALLSVRHAIVSFPDVRIVGLKGDRAEVVVTARLQASLRTGDEIDDVRELRCELRKVGGKWRFRDVREEAVLER